MLGFFFLREKKKTSSVKKLIQSLENTEEKEIKICMNKIKEGGYN